jgi:hypothetical protein
MMMRNDLPVLFAALALILCALVLQNREEPKVCNDYQLLGRVYKTCLTDMDMSK